MPRAQDQLDAKGTIRFGSARQQAGDPDSEVPARPIDADKRRVQVWFGDTVINSYTATAPEARRFVTLMGRRFAGLRITVDGQPLGSDPALPHKLEWDLTVR